MPILLVFTLIAACLPVDWPEPPFDPAQEVALSLTGGAILFVLSVAFILRTWVVRTLRRDPGRRSEVAQTYGRWRRLLFFMNLGMAAACVLVFGWGWLVRFESQIPWGEKYIHAPFSELLVPLPYFITLFGSWVIYYDAERTLHRAIHGSGRPFWSRSAYLFHNLRQFSLMVMLPVSMIVINQTILRSAPETAHSELFQLGSFAAVPAMMLLMPLVMKPLLGLKSMPRGPVRDRLETLAKRLNFRCTDFLLWPTHGAAVNAMIAGLLPRVRYVVFTDRILEDLPPDELDAVFGHEIGHAKHGHIWLYSVFLMLSLLVLAAFGLFLEIQIKKSGVLLMRPEYTAVRTWLEANATWFYLPPVVLFACYLFVVFGALSRRCERQADVFGCKAVSCEDPNCTGHDENTVFPSGASCLCPTGIRTFARALARVGDLNGISMTPEKRWTPRWMIRGTWAWIRAWQHSPMPHRVAYLLSLIDNPQAERAFQRRLFVFKCALMLALVAAFVALGQSVGWEKLFAGMFGESQPPGSE